MGATRLAGGTEKLDSGEGGSLATMCESLNGTR